MRLHIVRIVIAVCLIVVGLLPLGTRAAQAPFVASPGGLRFRLIGDEPIATGDGRTLVGGWKVVVLKDTKSDQCYVSFIAGSAMSTTGPSVCP